MRCSEIHQNTNKNIGKLPQDAEGDVFCDKGDGDAGDQSNQVGGKDGRYSAIVVAENDFSLFIH